LTDSLTRRDVLKAGAAGAAGAGMLGALGESALRAMAAPPRCGRLKDIDHVVILMQENRSFDHYFGRYRGVRGFADPKALKLHDGSGNTVFAQPGYNHPGFNGHLHPFRLRTSKGEGCAGNLDNPNHDWGTQHRMWHNGRMDHFLSEQEKIQGDQGAPVTMGYHERGDIPFYYALADAFTICDAFHSSVIGPTDPNRLYAMSATLDFDGRHGGPLLETLVAKRASKAGKFTWKTYPEQLSAHGIGWKVYTAGSGGIFQNVLPYFRRFQTHADLHARGIDPTYPGDFLADIQSGHLPKVSWVLPQLTQTEHPPFPPDGGEYAASQVLKALTDHPKLWAKTALFVTYDENGGYFDHVRPLVAPRGTHGEYVTVSQLPSAAQGIRGPIGLGFRVPTLVVSPFSRGGFVCSERFDHTSILQFLEARFGVEVPNLTHWRRSVTGDMTSAFNFVKPNRSVPHLPQTSSTASCGGAATPTPTLPNRTPKQEKGKARRPSGICSRRSGR